MKVIELAGPSGVGKSTIAEALIAARGYCSALPVGLKDAERGVAFRSDVKPFVTLIRDAVATARVEVGPRYSFVMRTLWRTLLAQRGGGCTVLDGGLLRRAHGIDALRSDVPIEHYYRLMPTADLTVFLTTDEETIIARNIERGTSERIGMIRRALQLDALARSILIDRGAEVLTVDTGFLAGEVVKLIEERIASRSQ